MERPDDPRPGSSSRSILAVKPSWPAAPANVANPEEEVASPRELKVVALGGVALLMVPVCGFLLGGPAARRRELAARQRSVSY